MKCEVCGKEININYGNAYTTICRECVGIDESAELMNRGPHRKHTGNPIYEFKFWFQQSDLKEKPLMIISKL